jgi:heterodisulfide reductase subunit A-like polyferredoxin
MTHPFYRLLDITHARTHTRVLAVLSKKQPPLLYTHTHTHTHMSQVIIVGGGLAGLSAAHTVLEQGGNVLVIDKNP